MTEIKREKWKKEKEQREGRSHRSGVGRKRIAHDIRIIGHNMLLSKAIRAISIDHPREMWRVNQLTSSNSSCYSFPPLKIMTNKVKEKEKKKKRWSIFLNSKGRHEAGDVEFLIVQSLKELPNIGNATPL